MPATRRPPSTIQTPAKPFSIPAVATLMPPSGASPIVGTDRRRIRPRCPRCAMFEPLCLCAELPRIEARAAVVLVAHEGELRRPSNTGRLALSILVGATWSPFGAPERPLDPAALRDPGSAPLGL